MQAEEGTKIIKVEPEPLRMLATSDHIKRYRKTFEIGFPRSDLRCENIRLLVKHVAHVQSNSNYYKRLSSVGPGGWEQICSSIVTETILLVTYTGNGVPIPLLHA